MNKDAIIECDSCKSTLEYHKIKIRTTCVKPDLYKKYFKCNNCKKEYIICYLSKEMIDLQGKIKKARKNCKWEKVERLTEKMKELHANLLPNQELKKGKII